MSLRRENSTGNNSNNPSNAKELRRLARETFGWNTLRPGQLEAIEAAASGRDVLAVMPTGYGKSAVYQVAALALPGIAVVVSPLIALQHDQVEDLDAALGDGRAFALNSTNSVAEHDDAWDAASDGTGKFLFLAPEQLVREEVMDKLKTLAVNLLVVDEAHCVSAWGHDFRPDYLRLGDVVEQLGRPAVVALTATASAPVQAEIIERLGLREPMVQARGFDRPNLHLDVVRHADDGAKRSAVTATAVELARPESSSAGLIYVARRKDTDYYCEQLAEAGVRAEAYHSGRRKSDREDIHRQFLDGELDVVVATSAFGMGIDKPDVRFVLHADITDSVDSYYQEIGRAGRDGEPARVVLHYRPEDLGLRRFFAAKRPDEEALRMLVDVLAAASGPQSARDLREATGLSARKLTALLNLLSEAGAVTTDDGAYKARLPRTPGTAGTDDAAVAAAAAAAAVSAAIEHAESRERVDNSRVEMMRQYAETDSCRRQFLLGYFGEELPEPCGNCDICSQGTAAAQESNRAPRGDEEFPLQSAVVHPEWGAGVVIKLEEDRITVLFETEGYRALARNLIAEKRLLTLRT